MDFERGKWCHGPLIDIDRESGQFRPGLLTEQICKDRAADPGQLPDGVNARIVEATFCRWPDAPDQTDRKRVEKVALVRRGHSNDAVRLGHLRSHLGEVLGAGDANGQGEADLVADTSADCHGDICRCSKEMDGAGNVEECLIDRHPLNPGREVVKDRHDSVTELLVAAELATDEKEITTKLAGPPPGHAAADAVTPGFIRRREHHAAADRDGSVPQRWVQQLLN